MSQPPPSSAPPAPQVPTSACDACGHAFSLRAAACPECGFPRRHDQANPFAKPKSTKSPREAMWASLFWPGGGHFYAGDKDTGAVLTVISIVILAASALILGPTIGLLLWLGLALYAAIDSGRLLSESPDR